MTVFEHGVIDWNGDKRRIAVIPARAYEPYEPYPEAASEGKLPRPLDRLLWSRLAERNPKPFACFRRLTIKKLGIF